MEVCGVGLDEMFKSIFYFRSKFEGGKGGVKPPAAADDDDDIDLFGDDGGNAAEEAKKLAEKKKAEAASAKKKVIERSLLLIDIKPTSSDTDMEELKKLVLAITMEGLTWKEQTKLIPVAFGIKKLQVGCVIIDELVSTEDLMTEIEAVGMDKEKVIARKEREERGCEDDEEEEEEEEDEGYVQSAEIISFNKI